MYPLVDGSSGAWIRLEGGMPFFFELKLGEMVIRVEERNFEIQGAMK